MAKPEQLEQILNHPEKDKIIGKLVSGETPKQVSEYLKIKFNLKDEAHLRVARTTLTEFVDKYMNQYQALTQLLEDEREGKVNKKIAASLLETKAWRERVLQETEEEINLKRKILDFLHKMEVRAEQIFDRIQEDPRIVKHDYVMIKYFENLISAIEKADKLINERPDQLIQHNVTIQMVEQHSVAFQEAIRDLLKELDPETSARFMELMIEKMHSMELPEELKPPKPKTMEKRLAEASTVLSYDFEEEIPDG